MKSGAPIDTLHHALAHAAHAAFPEIEYEDRDWEHYSKTKEDKRIKKKRKPSEYDMEVRAMFPQTWGSTALGFGGIGGAAMTTAYTVVVECMGAYAVYFGGHHAYTITQPNDQFFEDVAKQRMSAVRGAQKAYTREAA
jgi:hypothetical protein